MIRFYHTFFSPSEVRDRQLKTSDDFVWAIDTMFTGKFTIDVEFLDLKAAPPPVSTSPLRFLPLLLYL